MPRKRSKKKHSRKASTSSSRRSVRHARRSARRRSMAGFIGGYGVKDAGSDVLETGVIILNLAPGHFLTGMFMPNSGFRSMTSTLIAGGLATLEAAMLGKKETAGKLLGKTITLATWELASGYGFAGGDWLSAKFTKTKAPAAGQAGGYNDGATDNSAPAGMGGVENQIQQLAAGEAVNGRGAQTMDGGSMGSLVDNRIRQLAAAGPSN
jgi:hypothetical protein